MNVHHDRNRHRFTTPVDGEEAVVDYEETSSGAWDLTHTFVPPEHRHCGIASGLVRRVLEEARREGRSIVPTCPFVSSFLDDRPEFRDLVEDG